jgi:hypothetical protein
VICDVRRLICDAISLLPELPPPLLVLPVCTDGVDAWIVVILNPLAIKQAYRHKNP